MLKNILLISILSATTLSPVGLSAAGSSSGRNSIPDPKADTIPSLRLLEAAVESDQGLWHMAGEAYANPVVNQWRMERGLTSVGGGYSTENFSNNPDPRLGKGDRAWEAGASTYTKYKSTTLWGHASYTNGRTLDIKWNETADAPLLYPYLLADSIGGDLKREQYSFAGGYADRRGRWAWGAEIKYVALLQYRDVDPRPRNVVGRLTLSAGGMLRCFGQYYAGIGLNMLKYKQTNEIEFKSEMGVDKVFHLTGLTSHYNRFDGDGLSTYYDGYRFGLDLNLYPSDNRGAFATCRLSRFTFDNILTDLNRLPLAHVWHNQLDAEAGWLSPSSAGEWAATGRLSVYRRHGSENIFGDPASSIYPVIGRNEMYADNGVSIALAGRWGLKFGPVSRFQLMLSPDWSRRTTAYIEPYSYRVINAAGLTAEAAGAIEIASRWMLNMQISAKGRMPYSCQLSLVNEDAEMAGLERAERGSFLLDSSRSAAVGIKLGAMRMIGDKFALALNAEWNGQYWKDSASLNRYAININFIF